MEIFEAMKHCSVNIPVVGEQQKTCMYSVAAEDMSCAATYVSCLML